MATRCRVLFASLLVLVFVTVYGTGAPGQDKSAAKSADKKAGTKADKAADKPVEKAAAKAADKSADQAADKNAETVKQALAALSKALNARDPQAIAKQFTPTGEFIDADSNVYDSHEAIAGEFTALFEVNPHKHSVELTFDEVREISPGILSVDCTAIFSEAEEKQEHKETVDVDFSALLVKQANGSWLFASVRSEGEGNIKTPHAHLKRLEWLVGEWVDESDESTVHSNTRWSEDGNFLITEFRIQAAGRKVMSGTQRIGWDGSLDKFKSWVFDSEGGHAEGIWTELDDRWVVKLTGVRPNGDACSSTNTYEPTGPDAILFSSTDRIVGDEETPDFSSRVVKKPPEPDHATANTAPKGK